MEIAFRLTFILILFLLVLISSIYLRRAAIQGGQVDRSGEGRLFLILRLLLGFPLLLTFFTYALHPSTLSWTFIAFPAWIRSAFSALAFLCLLLMRAGFRNLGNNSTTTILPREKPRLVTTGPYRLIRHPIYAASLLLLCCLAIISASGLLFAFFLLGVPVFRCIVIPQEEKRLLQAFGDAYRDYLDTTGALIPKLPGL